MIRIIFSLAVISCGHNLRQVETLEEENLVCSPTGCPIQHKEAKKEEQQKIYCKEDMVHIHGEYCNVVKQVCLKWIDNPKLSYARCALYAKSECVSNRVHKEYCIDKYEMHEADGNVLGDKSWTDCKNLCNAEDKRLCDEDEWNFAAEGEEMFPYPYGYAFSKTICNIERSPLVCGKVVCDHREPITKFPDCISPFGIHNMIGNVDEWIFVPEYNHSQVPGAKMKSALKGGHFSAGRHRNRVKTTDHNETFHQISTGCRCCSDLK